MYEQSLSDLHHFNICRKQEQSASNARALVHNLREYDPTVQNEVKTLPSVSFLDKQFIVSSQNCCEAFCLWCFNLNNWQMPLMSHMKTFLPMDHVSNCTEPFCIPQWELRTGSNREPDPSKCCQAYKFLTPMLSCFSGGWVLQHNYVNLMSLCCWKTCNKKEWKRWKYHQ